MAAARGSASEPPHRTDPSKGRAPPLPGGSAASFLLKCQVGSGQEGPLHPDQSANGPACPGRHLLTFSFYQS